MESSVLERIKKVIKDNGYSITFLSKELGIVQTTLNRQIKGEVQLSAHTIEAFLHYFPSISASWLLTGEGSMLKDGQGNNNQSGRRNFIRYWIDVDATGGGVELFDDTTDGNYSEMVIPDFSDCTDAMRLVGDSMYPRYKAGQILVFKEWQESFIEYGQAYLVITRTGYRMLKYLQPAPEKNMVTCVSENAEKFPPFEIEIESIHKLYIVKGSVEQNTF